MSYGLTLCGACRRPRIVNMGDAETVCPYCGCSERRSDLQFFFQSNDLDEVRQALNSATGASAMLPTEEELAEKKRRIEESDPYSTLMYQYEHAGDLDSKMEVLATGLTSLKGEFTLDDVEDFAGKRAEKMLSAMLDRGFVFETRPGFYKARFSSWGCRTSSSLPCAGPRGLCSEASSSS